MPNLATIVVTLRAPVAGASAIVVNTNAADIVAALAAPVVAMSVNLVDHLSGDIVMTLAAPDVSSMVVEIEHVLAHMAITLPAPTVAMTTHDGEHLSSVVAMTLRAPQSRSAAIAYPPAWKLNWGAARPSMPRLHSQHQQHRSMPYTRYSGQRQSFIKTQAKRMNMSHEATFNCLSWYSAAQMLGAATSWELPAQSE